MVDGKLFLRVTPVLLLLLGLTQLSCRTPDDLVLGQPEVRQVRIWMDHSVQPPEPRADPEDQHISRGRRDRVEWYLDHTDPAASLEIRFKQTNPLTELRCPPQARRCGGGHARAGTVGRSYAYMIIVTSGNQRYESDPHIIVDP